MQGSVKGCSAQNRAPVGSALAMHRANPDVLLKYQCLSCILIGLLAGYTQSSEELASTWLQLANGPTVIGEFLL